MISTGAFQTEMDASNKQLTLAEKFAAVWEKKNAKAARVGGVSLMALSLAACGSDDSTTTTSSSSSSTSTSTTTTTVTPVAASLTTGVDAVTGTAGADTIDASRTADSLQTWNSADSIAGGDGADSLTAVIGANVTPNAGGVTGVENMTVTSIGARTVDFSSATENFITGVTSITNLASTGQANFEDITAAAELTVNNTAAATVFQFNDTVMSGADDTVTLNLIGVSGNVTVGTNTDADGDYETLVVNASGSASDLGAGDLIGADATTVTVNASVAMDFGTSGGFDKATSFSAAGSAGAVTATFEDFDAADGVAATNTTAKAITGGDGADSFDISAFEAADVGVVTVTGGAGNDTLVIGSYAESTLVYNGGEGTDTLSTAAAITAANAIGLSGIERLTSTGANTTHTLTNFTQNTTFTTLRAGGADTEFQAVPSTVTTLEILAAASTTAQVDYLIDGTVAGGNPNDLTVVVKADTEMSGTFQVADVEYLTIDSSDGTFAVGDDGGSGSGDGGLQGTDLVTLTLKGDNNIDLIGETASTDNYITGATLLTTIDASGVTGAATVQINASLGTSAMTVTGGTSTGQMTITTGNKADTVTAGGGILSATGGAGDDTITGGAYADILVGGVGADTINGGGLGDNIDAGAGIDDIDLGAADGGSDTVQVDFATSANRDLIENFTVGATNGDIIQTDTNTDATEAITAAADVGTITATGNLTVNTNFGVVLLANNLSGTFDAANSLTGTNLISALGGTITVANAAEKVLFAIDNGTDTGIYFGSAGASNTGIVASELALIAVLEGVADATTLTSDNFTT